MCSRINALAYTYFKNIESILASNDSIDFAFSKQQFTISRK